MFETTETGKQLPRETDDPRRHIGSLICARPPGKRRWMVAVLTHVYGDRGGVQACAGDLVWDVPDLSAWMVPMNSRSKALGQFIGQTFKSPEDAYAAMLPFVARGN